MMWQAQKPVYIKAKPERQCQYGLEQITLAEAVNSWLGCYLRPNSFFIRGNHTEQSTVKLVKIGHPRDQILVTVLNNRLLRMDGFYRECFADCQKQTGCIRQMAVKGR
jgi:hypothetical protein